MDDNGFDVLFRLAIFNAGLQIIMMIILLAAMQLTACIHSFITQ
jgi:hypothetical protein